jgi:hypothetical protein
LAVRRSELEIRLEDLKSQLSGVDDKEKLMPSKADINKRKLNDLYTEKRRRFIRDLNMLISERDRRLLELKTEEKKKKNEYDAQIRRLNIVINNLESELKNLREHLWSGGSLLKSSSEVLYIPFYLFSRDKNVDILLPPIVLGRRSAAADVEKAHGMAGIQEFIEGDWSTMSMLLFEARETFDLLNEKNHDRVRQGIDYLHEMNALGRIREMIFIKEYFSK